MSAYSKFTQCLDVTSRWEGGWSNHPLDPGGKTKYGVTEAAWLAYNRRQGVKNPTNIKNITRVQAEKFYQSEYWLAGGCDKLGVGVDLATFDACVNSGVSRGLKWLLASIGGEDHITVKRICAKRLGFVQSLKTWATFGRGWANRIADIEAKGVAWALAAKGNVKEQLAKEAKSANASVKKNAQGAAGGAATTGSPTLMPAETADQIAGYVMGGLIIAGLAILGFFILRTYIHKQREKAYLAEMEKVAT